MTLRKKFIVHTAVFKKKVVKGYYHDYYCVDNITNFL